MPQKPLASEAYELLVEELVHLRELPYSLWSEVVDAPLSKVVTGRDGREYRFTLEARKAHDGSDNIRVSVSLKRQSFRYRSLRDGFVITPDNHFV